jgi:hypothetical protein
MRARPVNFGSFGSTPAELSVTDFYEFFHFGVVDEVGAGKGATRATHRTEGGFRDRVLLTVTVVADGQIDALSLQVARSFIDDRRDGIFARDAVSSFIREGAVGQGFEYGFAHLLRDIRTSPLYRRGGVVYTDSNPVPPTPPMPGDFIPAFGVYCGAAASFAARLEHIDLRMSNDRFDGVGALTVSYHRWS